MALVKQNQAESFFNRVDTALVHTQSVNCERAFSQVRYINSKVPNNPGINKDRAIDEELRYCRLISLD
eukprot:snap_masked-scaffold_1-processed-gene-17.14-mRNA-1 protein AED:1.00 eAED:1.00 QI:0/0/0/0/1/1/2/0/67